MIQSIDSCSLKKAVITPPQAQPQLRFEVALQKMKQVCLARFLWRGDSQLTHMLKTISHVDLHKLMQRFFQEALEWDSFNPAQLWERVVQMIPQEKVRELNKQEVKSLLQTSKSLLEEAKLYLTKTEKTPTPSLHQEFNALLAGIVSLIESVVSAFGMESFFKPADGEAQVEAKSNKILTLLSLFGMITTMVFPVIGVATGAWILGGTLLGIAALSLVWPHIRPIATSLPANAENWSKQVQATLHPPQGRKESLDQIANILKMNRHALLVGPSRVGKSLTAKAFVSAIEQGIYPEFKGKKVFRINTADIIDYKPSYLGGGNNILNMISEKMGRHRDQIILVLDEIHMACKGNSKIADQLKTFLDEGGEFPHVIAITTEQEFQKYVKENHAFALRFDRVDIKNTDREETIEILAHAILDVQPSPIIAENALEAIYDKSAEVSEAPQPASALRLLRKCIHHIRVNQISPLEKKISALSKEIFSLRAQCAASWGKKKQLRMQIEELEGRLLECNTLLKKEKKEEQSLGRAKQLFNYLSSDFYQTILKGEIQSQAHFGKNEARTASRLALNLFMQQVLEQLIKDKSKELKIHSTIDQEVVDLMAKPG